MSQVPDPLIPNPVLPAVSRARTFDRACHTIGKGDRVGPDLWNVTAARDPAWLARYVATPDKVLAAGDPIAVKLFEKYNRVAMPNLSLGPDEVKVLLAYIQRQSRATSPPASNRPAR
jgi:protein SCO1/2